MGPILGHDCDGRPLRAGDRVAVLTTKTHPHWVGRVVTIVGSAPPEVLRTDGPRYAETLEISDPHPHRPHGWVVWGWTVRRIDQQPADQSFEELVKGLKSGAPVCAE